MKLGIATAACLLLVTPFARATEMSDSDLVTLCVEELKTRQQPNELEENTTVVAARVERTERQEVADVQVMEAEGRRLVGRCIIRNGRVFDYKG